MFELMFACEAHFEMPLAISSAVSPPYKEHRYCPVLIARGRHKQYLEHEQPISALVAKPSALCNPFPVQVSVTFDPAAFLRRHDYQVIPEKIADADENHGDIPWDLLDYITDAIPEFKPEHITSAVAFRNVTEEDLPRSFFEEGMELAWNDKYIAKNHPARKHCGEGPFLVVRDESYLITFTPGSPEKTKKGSDRLVLENLSTGHMIIAHGGYFNSTDPKYISLLEELYPETTSPHGGK